MPKRQSAPAGTYVLTGVQWRQFHEDGSFTLWEQGDEVDLTAEEATRLTCGEGPRKSFVAKGSTSSNGDGSSPVLDNEEDIT